MKKGSLTSAFAKIQKDNELYPCPAGEPLTAGETALVKSIFGGEIKTEHVRKYFSAEMKPGKTKGYAIPAQTFGVDSIKFYGARYRAVDYSQSKDLFNYGTFVHEMTHIWQNQQPDGEAGSNTPQPGRSPGRSYKYTLTPLSHFKDFGEEQQAAIIEDYACQFLYPGRPEHTEKPPHATPLLLQKVVESRFPQARKTRLALEAQKPSRPTPQPPKALLNYIMKI